MRFATRSALVVLCPEADDVLGRWRDRYDPAARLGIPAHITLLYPFADPVDIDAAVIDTVSHVATEFAAFDFELSDVSSFGSRVLWVAPEPRDKFVALTEALVREFPQYPRYGGKFGADITPHVTVTEGATPQVTQAAARAAAELLPVSSRCSEVALLAGGDRPWSWNVIERFPLTATRSTLAGSGVVMSAGSVGSSAAGPSVSTVTVGDEEWERHRNTVTRRLFGIDAATFVATYTSGTYDPCDVEEALAFFPELG